MRSRDEGTIEDEPTSRSPSWNAEDRPTLSQRKRVRREAPENIPHELARLTKTLALSTPQQEKIHPALLRTRSDYDPARPHLVLGSDFLQLLGPPLGRADFEDVLFAILDGEQQLDKHITAVSEADSRIPGLATRLFFNLDTDRNGRISKQEFLMKLDNLPPDTAAALPPLAHPQNSRKIEPAQPPRR